MVREGGLTDSQRSGDKLSRPFALAEHIALVL